MKVAIVGGGPAGLYFARLPKRERPDYEVDVYELSPEGATWGFGVGLGGRTMRDIRDSDADVYKAMVAAMKFDDQQIIHLNGEEFKLEYPEKAGAISRLRLIEILTKASREVGVRVHFEHAVGDICEFADCDLVVAADGVNSTIRSQRVEAFGTEIRTLTNHFAWYGVERAMTPMALVFREWKGGVFCGHYYAYEDDMSTFVAECDDHTWCLLQLEDMSDGERQSLIEEIFAPELAGEKLLDNHSIWRQFPATSNARWHDGNVVLLGDNLKAAHFSIGSGTRLAMEDAAALFRALQERSDNVSAALTRFKEIRGPSRALFGEAARKSFEWYEDMALHMKQPLMPFIYNFLTRTGRIDDERLKRYAPGFYEAWQEYSTEKAG